MTAATELETEGAVDEGRATERVLEMDGCVSYADVPRQADRDREALLQANAMIDAEDEIAHYQALEEERAAAFAANALCMHCNQPVTDPATAMYFPALKRYAHGDDCGPTVLQQRWGHLFGGVVVRKERAA